MSYGLLEESKSQSTYIRGTAASSAVSKMLLKTNWGDLDLLLIEMPN
jgi:Mrp family chromosome partitioning ATPase